MAEYLLSLLEDKYSVAYLSRGYKRKSTGFKLYEGVPDPNVLGDEATMIALKHPKTKVAVCEKREIGIEKLMALECPPQVIVLDDVFQHRQVKPAINILLTEYANPYFADKILPFGELREFKSGRRRANYIVATKTPEKIDPITRHNFIDSLQAMPCQKVFFSNIQYLSAKSVFGEEETSLNEKLNILLVTAIANPKPLLLHLQERHSITHIAFPDHHNFSIKELKQIVSKFEANHHSIILTTEKDASRLQTEEAKQVFLNLPLYYIPIKDKMADYNDLSFDKTLLKAVEENIAYQEMKAKCETSSFL